MCGNACHVQQAARDSLFISEKTFNVTEMLFKWFGVNAAIRRWHWHDHRTDPDWMQFFCLYNKHIDLAVRNTHLEIIMQKHFETRFKISFIFHFMLINLHGNEILLHKKVLVSFYFFLFFLHCVQCSFWDEGSCILILLSFLLVSNQKKTIVKMCYSRWTHLYIFHWCDL